MNSEVVPVTNDSTRLRIMEELNMELDQDLVGADIKWVIFGMAMQSYRYEQLLVPYPPFTTHNGGYPITKLHLTVSTMPDMRSVKRRVLNNFLSREHVNLLHWLFVDSGTPQLLSLSRREQMQLWRELGRKPKPKPQFVFRVRKRTDPEEADPLDLPECVYYSGEMDELYSMISTTQDIEGNELYYHTDMQNAFNNAEWTPGWGQSMCGTLMRCVAVCQLHAQVPEMPKIVKVHYLIVYCANYLEKMQRFRRHKLKALPIRSSPPDETVAQPRPKLGAQLQQRLEHEKQLKAQMKKEREMEREKEREKKRERHRKMELEIERAIEGEMDREIELEIEREIERQMGLEGEREMQREKEREKKRLELSKPKPNMKTLLIWLSKRVSALFIMGVFAFAYSLRRRT